MAKKTWKQLQALVELKQKGFEVPEEDRQFVDDYINGEKPFRGVDMAVPTKSDLDKLSTGDISRKYLSDLADYGNTINAGYGSSRYDESAPFEQWIINPNEARAQRQTAANKLLSGITKMVPFAFATALDSTLGILTGLGNIAVDAVDGDGSFKPLDSFIGNPFSIAMDSIREWADREMPNYRTEEEIRDEKQWWKHLNANFWGDSVMKNMGFTLGAMLAGLGWSSTFINKTKKIINNAYKNAAKAAIEGDAAAGATVKEVMQGAALNNPDAIYKSFAKTKNLYNKSSVYSQVVGGLGGSVGESRMEAMMAANEFRDSKIAELDENIALQKQSMLQDIMSNPNYINSDGSINADGYAAAAAVDKQLDDYKSSAIEKINKEASDLAAYTFWLNIPIVAGENIILFGRQFSGGFKTQSRRLVSGKFGNYKPRSTTAGISLRHVGAAAGEGIQEGVQKIISEGAKEVASDNMAYFYNGKYDLEATKTFFGWMSGILNTAGDVVKDPLTWQEVAIGALTGGLFGTIETMSKLREGKENADLAKNLNNTISSKEFQDLIGNAVRHIKLETEQERDAMNNNSYSWHNKDHEKLVNLVMMFDKAGKLVDLEEYIDSFSNISLDEVAELKDSFIDETDPEFKKKSIEDTKKWLLRRADQVKESIREYRDFHDAINFVALGTTDSDVIDEMVFSSMQLRNFEKRYKSILNDVINKVRPRIESVANKKNKKGEPTEEAIKAQNILDSFGDLTTLFGTDVVDPRGGIQENIETGFVAYFIDKTKQANVLSALEKLGVFVEDKSLKKSVEDLQKLVYSRQLFYSKILDPRFREKFEKAKKNIDEVERNLKDDAVKENIDKVYNDLKSANNIKDFGKIYKDNKLDSFNSSDLEKIYNRSKKEGVKKIEEFFGYINSVINLLNNVKSESRKLSHGSASAANNIVDYIDNTFSMYDFLENVDVSDLPQIAFAKHLLKEFDLFEEEKDIIMNILKKRIAEEELAKSFGKGAQRQEKKNSTDSINNDSVKQEDNNEKFESYKNFVLSIQDYKNNTLLQLSSGDFSSTEQFLGFQLTDEQKTELTTISIGQVLELKAKNGAIGVTTKEPDNVGNLDKPDLSAEPGSEEEKEFIRKDTKTIRGNKFSVYDLDQASKNKKVPFNTKSKGTMETINWMRDHKVQEFLDSGALSLLNNFYESRGEQMPIFFIANPHLIADNLHNNPFVVEYNGKNSEVYDNKQPTILFAVEITDDNSQVIKKIKDNNLFSDESLITIEGKKYQVIGQSFDPNLSTMTSEKAKLYEDVKKACREIFYYSYVESIMPQYRNDVSNNEDFPDTGKWYVAKKSDSGERLFTTLNYQIGGRVERTDPGVRIPLKGALSEYEKINKFPEFVVQTEEENRIPRDLNPPLGSVWMKTIDASGKDEWFYVTTEKTKSYDFENHRNTPIISRLYRYLEDIFSNSSDITSKVNSANALNNYIYLGIGNLFGVEYTQSGIPALRIGGTMAYNVDEAIRVIQNKNVNFQVDANVTTERYFRDLIESDILISDVENYSRFGSMFGVNFLKVVKGANNQVIDIVPSNYIHVPSMTENTGTSVLAPNIRLGSHSYDVLTDGSVIDSITKERVTDNSIIVKTIALYKAMPDFPESFVDEAYNVTLTNENGRVEKNVYIYYANVNGVDVYMKAEGDDGAVVIINKDEYDRLYNIAVGKIPIHIPIIGESRNEDISGESQNKNNVPFSPIRKRRITKDNKNKTSIDIEILDINNINDESKIDC